MRNIHVKLCMYVCSWQCLTKRIDYLFQVRRAPQRRGTPRPNQSKPHLIRSVEDITEDELQLVADNMTDKVYDRVTVSSQPHYGYFRKRSWCHHEVTEVLKWIKLSVLLCSTLLLMVLRGRSGLHVSSVPPENHRHQDVLPQWGMSGDSGSVLRAVPEEQIRRGCEEGAARSGQSADTPAPHCTAVC